MLIANLKPEVGGQVLEKLPEAVQPDILHRIARLGPITPDAVETLRALLPLLKRKEDRGWRERIESEVREW